MVRARDTCPPACLSADPACLPWATLCADLSPRPGQSTPVSWTLGKGVSDPGSPLFTAPAPRARRRVMNAPTACKQVRPGEKSACCCGARVRDCREESKSGHPISLNASLCFILLTAEPTKGRFAKRGKSTLRRGWGKGSCTPKLSPVSLFFVLFYSSGSSQATTTTTPARARPSLNVTSMNKV